MSPCPVSELTAELVLFARMGIYLVSSIGRYLALAAQYFLTEFGCRMTDKNDDKSSWATGGGLLLGIGVGFFFLQASALAFVGSIMAGLGLGLIISAILSSRSNKKR